MCAGRKACELLSAFLAAVSKGPTSFDLYRYEQLLKSLVHSSNVFDKMSQKEQIGLPEHELTNCCLWLFGCSVHLGKALKEGNKVFTVHRCEGLHLEVRIHEQQFIRDTNRAITTLLSVWMQTGLQYGDQNQKRNYEVLEYKMGDHTC